MIFLESGNWIHVRGSSTGFRCLSAEKHLRVLGCEMKSKTRTGRCKPDVEKHAGEHGEHECKDLGERAMVEYGYTHCEQLFVNKTKEQKEGGRRADKRDKKRCPDRYQWPHHVVTEPDLIRSLIPSVLFTFTLACSSLPPSLKFYRTQCSPSATAPAQPHLLAET
jgi:hypothetical protein